MKRTLILSALLLTAYACSCDESASDAPDAAPVDSQNASDAVSGSCGTSNDCSSDMLCHPQTKRCVAAMGTCSSHAECSAGTYCEIDEGRCLSGHPGSPCESDENCTTNCIGNVCGCDGLSQEQQLMGGGPLDIFLVFDHSGSMLRDGRGRRSQDCSYVAGETPPEDSKACYATYAVADYLIGVDAGADTRLALEFMSLAAYDEDDPDGPNDCDGQMYTNPAGGLVPLPVDPDHQLIQTISDEEFEGGQAFGTHIEGALNGIALYTSANQTSGREIIGVLLTDGDPNGCEEDIDELAKIMSDHLEATGIRTYIIGMEGADEHNLERLAIAGGAEPHNEWCGSLDPPCHHWNVGDGSGDAIASALQAIVQMSVPLPCEIDITNLTPPPGETLDYGKINVTLTESNIVTTMGQVMNMGACPGDQSAWYYDDPGSPTKINLCPHACSLVMNAGDGARVDVVVGCNETVVLR